MATTSKDSDSNVDKFYNFNGIDKMNYMYLGIRCIELNTVIANVNRYSVMGLIAFLDLRTKK